MASSGTNHHSAGSASVGHMDWSNGMDNLGPAADIFTKLKVCMSKISNLDALQLRTSLMINWEYWRLGVIYSDFCKVCIFCLRLTTTFDSNR